MNLIKCKNGHYYNSDKFPYCPHCITSNESSITPDNANQDNIETENINPMLAASDPYFEHLTVGWLVCLTGFNRGYSFPIYAGDNHIGRNANMNIRLRNETTISRENHAIVQYNSNMDEFYLCPGSTTNPTTINNNSIDNKVILSDHDLIQLGDCQLLFIKLCNDQFKW